MILIKRHLRVRIGFALLVTCGILFPFFSPAVASPGQAPEPDPPTLDRRQQAINGLSALPKAPLSLPLQEWSFHKTADNLHPDGNEQQFIWYMNRARANPTWEGAWLANTGDADVEGAISYFGVDLGLMQDEFSAIESKPPAAFDVRLYEAALDHSENLILKDAQDHDGQFDRINESGFDYTQAAGIVYSYMRSSLHGHGAFAIDWGNDGGDGSGMQPGRGHRKAIMSIGGDYTNMGVAAVGVDDSSKTVGPLVITGNFCSADTTSPDHFNRFLVGTVWQDANANNLYDPGEGMGGVTVMPDSGNYYAVTANSGGYAVPIASPDSYVVSFTGGGIGTVISRAVVVGDDSVLLDMEYDPAGDTGPKSITNPASGISTSTAYLNGSVIPGGETAHFYFQYGATTNYGNLTSTGSTTTDTDVFAAVSGLAENATYHFRLVVYDGQATSYGVDQAFQTEASSSSTDDENSDSEASSDSGGGGGGCFITIAIE